MVTINNIEVFDLRFPTSNELDGSDAMNTVPDYSAAYIIIKTNKNSLEGHGHTLTMGRGNDICVKAIETLSDKLNGMDLDDIIDNNLGLYYSFIYDSQLRWLGPEKGVIHLATAAIFNAIWDLIAKYRKKPLWKIFCEMEPRDFIKFVDFKYIEDVLSKEQALSILNKKFETRSRRIETLKKSGYPAYTTSAGWLGYSEEKLKLLCKQAKNENWRYVKFKVGLNLDDDISRLTIARKILGNDIVIMIDANQVWNVNQAIDWVNSLKQFDPWFIEEPTSPDDILGHLRIKERVSPIMVATGEHCQNKVMFKQFFQSNAIDICQLDSCRLGGINEILAVQLLAEKFKKPICPHAGGVGLCEYVQHLAIIDYVCVSGNLEGRVLEYISHLHNNFLYPSQIKNGAYMLPEHEGYSATVKRTSIKTFQFPNGEYWIKNKK
jgi:L-fuconate dehydratase